MYKHIQSTLFSQWFFSEYIHTSDIFFFKSSQNFQKFHWAYTDQPQDSL